MRTLLRFSFAMLIAIALFSCGKDDGDSTPSATEGQLTAEINGSNTTLQVYATKVVTEEDGTVIYIFGTSTDGQKSFALWVLANSVTARTYPFLLTPKVMSTIHKQAMEWECTGKEQHKQLMKNGFRSKLKVHRAQLLSPTFQTPM